MMAANPSEDLDTAADKDNESEYSEIQFNCICGASYRSRAAALRCCGDRFGGEA